jgi:hypothetical protein
VSSCTSDACFPPGPAVPVDGGYRVSGQWAFGSGCQHTHWLQTMGIITDHGAIRMGADGCQENTCGGGGGVSQNGVFRDIFAACIRHLLFAAYLIGTSDNGGYGNFSGSAGAVLSGLKTATLEDISTH